MLDKEPESRPTPTQCLEHPWFKPEQLSGRPSFMAYADNELQLQRNTRSSILNRVSKNLNDRKSLKLQGRLNISQVMPVQNLIQDLLKNGIDLRQLDSKLRHSLSLRIKDGPAEEQKQPNLENLDFDDTDHKELEDMMDTMLMSGETKAKSHSMVVKTIRATKYTPNKDNLEKIQEERDSIIDMDELNSLMLDKQGSNPFNMRESITSSEEKTKLRSSK